MSFPQVCQICDKSFKSHRTLDNHMKKQHGLAGTPKVVSGTFLFSFFLHFAFLVLVAVTPFVRPLRAGGDLRKVGCPGGAMETARLR